VELHALITETQQTYDRIATEYAQRNSAPWPGIVADVRAFAANLPPAAVVADVGCGPGRDAALIREQGFRVAGFDLSMGQLRAGGDADVAQADMRQLPLRTASVDAIWCHAALLHIPRPGVPAVLAEFARTVRPGGQLYLSVAEGNGEGFEAASRYGSARQRWFTLHREPDLVALVVAAGFAVDQVSRTGGHREWLNLRAHRQPDARPRVVLPPNAPPRDFPPPAPPPPAAFLELRQATAADLPAVQHVISAAYDKYLSRMDRPPAPLLRDYGSAVRGGTVWVTGSPIVGLISLIPADGVLLIENVAVHPDHQGTGLGRRLMEFAEQQARRRGMQRLALYTNEVMTENQAIYAHLGYRVTDRRSEAGYRRLYFEKTLPVS
jgi:SAM-dependent methyltransferase/GNAT superfamily N-acetyltransferase